MYVKGTPSIHPPTPLCFGGRNNGNVDKRNLPKKFRGRHGVVGRFCHFDNIVEINILIKIDILVKIDIFVKLIFSSNWYFRQNWYFYQNWYIFVKIDNSVKIVFLTISSTVFGDFINYRQLYQLLIISSTFWSKYQVSVPVNCNFAVWSVRLTLNKYLYLQPCHNAGAPTEAFLPFLWFAMEGGFKRHA